MEEASRSITVWVLQVLCPEYAVSSATRPHLQPLGSSKDNNGLMLWEFLGHLPQHWPTIQELPMPRTRSFDRYIFLHKLEKCFPMDFSNILNAVYHTFLSLGQHSLLHNESPSHFPFYLHNTCITSSVCSISNQGPVIRLDCIVFRKQWLGCGKGLLSYLIQKTSALTLAVFFFNQQQTKSDFCNLNWTKNEESR